MTAPREDATALRGALERREAEPRAVLRATLAAAGRHAGLGAVARLEPGLAEPHIDAFEGTWRPGHPRGTVPILAKDLGDAARGLAPAAGSPALRRRVKDPKRDDPLMSRLRSGGYMPIGLSAVPEFGLSLVTEAEGALPVRNPWNPDLSAGGSSGGAAAAVAAGIVALAHATDAAGSIRVPAACCGLVGLKPSRGFTVRSRLLGNDLMGLGSELVLARSVRDVLDALSLALTSEGHDLFHRWREFRTPRPLVGLAIPDRCDPTQAGAARAAAEALARDGCDVREVPAPDALGAKAAALARAILTVSLAEWLRAARIDDAEVSSLAAAVAREGRETPGTAVFAAAREVARLTERADRLLDGVTVLLMPVLSGPPPRIGAFDPAPTTPARRFAAMEALAPNAALANVLGLPALALPFGMADGLPAGVQLWARTGGDHALMTFGLRLEALAPPLAFPHRIAGFDAAAEATTGHHAARPRTRTYH